MLAVLGVLTTVLPATALAVPPSCIRAALPVSAPWLLLGPARSPASLKLWIFHQSSGNHDCDRISGCGWPLRSSPRCH